MAANNGILATLARKEDLSNAAPARHTALRSVAESLSRRNADAALLELYAEAVQRLTLLAYEVDDAGYCNIDAVTYRILIPLPFGRMGHKRWGIAPAESVVLREMIQTRQPQTPHRPPGLFLYDSPRRCWRLNLYDFDTLADGLAYWQRWPLGVAEYREARSRRTSR